MTPPRRWDASPPAIPKRPYRDTVLVYGGMALIIVLVGALTGGGLLRSIVIAVLFFVTATAWNWRRFRRRLRSAETGQR